MHLTKGKTMKNYLACGLVAATVFSMGCTPPASQLTEIDIDWVCDDSTTAPCDVVTDSNEGDVWNILNGADINSLTITSGTFARMSGGTVGTITSESSQRRFDIKGVSLSGGVVEGDVTSNGTGSISLSGLVELHGDIVANDKAQVMLESANFAGGNELDLNGSSRLYITALATTISDGGGTNCVFTDRSINLGPLGTFDYSKLVGGTGGQCVLQSLSFGPVILDAEANTSVYVFPPLPFDISDYL